MLRVLKIVAVSALAVFLALVGSPLVLALAGIVAVTYVAAKWRQWRTAAQFRQEWHPRGKDLLLVYSNSPHWQTYVETKWLPQWSDRAVVLNWSARKEWERSDRPEARLFFAFAGTREFNPLAVVVPQKGTVRVVRFWRAFRDYKHGKDRALVSAEGELEAALAESRWGV